MHKKIKRIEKELAHGKVKKAKKDLKSLEKADVKMDRKMERLEKKGRKK